MNSFYFEIKIDTRGAGVKYVQMEDFSRVASFVVLTHKYRVETHCDAKITITRKLVSGSKFDDHVLEKFKVSDAVLAYSFAHMDMDNLTLSGRT